MDNNSRGDADSKINQQFIAGQLGISRTTVSRCFTNHPGINPVTRARVFELAAQLGYQHMETKAPARARKKPGAGKRVGVLVCTDLDEYFRPDYESPGLKLCAGVSEFAQVHKVRLDLHYVDPKEKSLDAPSYRKITALHRREWDGVVLIYPFPREIIDTIGRTFPMVSLVEQYGTSDFNCVDVDHHKGMAVLMDRLAALGHERIGFYTRRYEVEAQWSLRRFSAYVEKLSRMGGWLREEDTVNVHPQQDMALEESFDYVRERREAGVKAWVCAADHQAYDLILGLRERGLRVPEDISITGFDGIAKPAWAPLLTTIVVPSREIGYTGGKRLLDVIGKRFDPPQHILIASRLQEGETAGPASASV